MGFFDKVKKKAQEAAEAAQNAISENTSNQDAAPPQAPEAVPNHTPAPELRAQANESDAEESISGPSFTWDGDQYPMPKGNWTFATAEEWFFKMEQVRDRMMYAEDENLEPMNDEDGDPLDPEEIVCVLEGFRDGGHYEVYRTWQMMQWAQQAGEDPQNYEVKMASIALHKVQDAKADSMRGAGGALDPVEGVSVEQWAHIFAGVAQGQDLNGLLSQAGMDRAKWDRVGAEWDVRMKADTTGSIMKVYGEAFAGGGQSQFSGQAGHAMAVGAGGDLSDEPIPFEKFCEIEAAMSCASERGEDISALLSSFGLKPADWGTIGGFWSRKIMQESSKYAALHNEYGQKYKAQYS